MLSKFTILASYHPKKSGFTLIELLIGMTIFVIGLTGIYALINTTIANVGYSRGEIVVSGLLREQIDLVMNMRDTNLRNYIPYDSIYIEASTQTRFASGIYLIENDLVTSSISINTTNGSINHSPVKLVKIDSLPTTIEDIWKKTQLRTDTQNRYFHSENTGTGTNFASYIIVTPLIVNGTEIKKDGKNQGWIIDARVLVKGNGYIREYDTKSMITDWQK